MLNDTCLCFYQLVFYICFSVWAANYFLSVFIDWGIRLQFAAEVVTDFLYTTLVKYGTIYKVYTGVCGII